MIVIIIRVSGKHLHNIVNDYDAQSHILHNNYKRKATENITNRTSKIMHHELCAIENGAMISEDIKNIQVSICEDVNYCKQYRSFGRSY